MTLPMLAPRPRESDSPQPRPAPTHSESEWAAVYSEIRRLYVLEQRKLRYIVEYMERKHSFKATEQMYKKRFAKWGFQKYARRSAAAGSAVTTKKNECKAPSSPGELGSMLACPRLSHDEGLTLMLLTGVRTWSGAFFERWHPGGGHLAPQPLQLPMDLLRHAETIEVSFAFGLVVDLLNRGRGKLAGRVARKAFLLVEDMLTLPGPVLIWNLLEAMHSMVARRHARLFRVFLAHLTALADGRLPKAHPLSAMLRSLCALVASRSDSASPSRPSSSRSVSTSSGSSDGAMTSLDAGALSGSLGPLLEQVWVFNAQIIFDHFDPDLLPLYCHIFWQSSSVRLPAAMAMAAGQWLGQTGVPQQQSSNAAAIAEAFRADGTLVSSLADDEHRMQRRLLGPRTDASPPQDYDMLRASSVAALRERWYAILYKGTGFNGDTTILLGILAALATDKVLEGGPPVMRRLVPDCDVTTAAVSRLRAGNVACAMRTLLDLSADSAGGGYGASPDAVGRIRAVLALREYAQGETHPQLVQEMWLLEEALVAAGEHGEAEAVRRSAYRRLEKYVQDIPVDVV